MFTAPWFAASGGIDMGRFLGINDGFDAGDGQWGKALMEMLVDPALASWVHVQSWNSTSVGIRSLGGV